MEKLISKISNGRALGLSRVPLSILKENADLISELLSKIINLSFKESAFLVD